MATKKSFKDSNPAMQFISAQEPADKPVQKSTVPGTSNIPPAELAAWVKANPLWAEKKTRRLQLVLRPSVYDLVKTAAAQSKTSVNDYIDKALEDLLSPKEDNHD